MTKWIRTDYKQIVNVAKFASIEICFIANRRYFTHFEPSQINSFAIVGNYQRNANARKEAHRYYDDSLKLSYPVYTQDSFDVLLIGGAFEAGHLQYLENQLHEEIKLLYDYLTGKAKDYDFWVREMESNYDLSNITCLTRKKTTGK